MKKRTAIFMPKRNKGAHKDQSELQEKKRAKIESIEIENKNENEREAALKRKKETENISELNKRSSYQGNCTIMKAKREHDDLDTRRIATLSMNESKTIGEQSSDRQNIKRPVALLPDRCTCKDCQIRNNFYFRKYKYPNSNIAINRKRNLKIDKDCDQVVKSALNVMTVRERKRESSYYINPLVTERPLGARKEEHIKEEGMFHQKYFVCLEVNNIPRQFTIGKDNRSPPWQQKKDEIERKKEVKFSPVYSTEKHLNGPFSTFSEEERNERTSVTTVAEPMFLQRNLIHCGQTVKQVGLSGNEPSADYGFSRYRGGYDYSERYCGCGECSKAKINTSINCDHSQWLTKRCERDEQNLRKMGVKEEKKESQRKSYSPCMTSANTDSEDTNSDKQCESNIEDYKVYERYDKPISKNENYRFIITKKVLQQNKKQDMVTSMNGSQRKSWVNGDMLSKREMAESSSKDRREIETERHVKIEGTATMERIVFSREGNEKIHGDNKKIVAKQQKEKDPGKKSRALANWLERKRVAELNDAFERLRRMVPTYGNEDRSLSKIKTLRYASTYIRHLALIHDKQCRYGIEDLKKGLMKVLEIDPMLQRCQEHLESHCII